MSILTDIYPIGSIIELYGSLDPNDFLDGLWYKDSSETILVGQDNNTFSSNLGTIIGADTAIAGYPAHIHQNSCRGITTVGNAGGMDFVSTGDTVKIINNGSNRVYEYYGPGRYTASTVGGGGTHENRMRSLQVCRWIKIDPILPDDLDFIYVANDFDGTQIPNKATGTTAFGPYLQQGTITKNGSGSSAYLSNGLSNSNYLYIDLTTTELDTLKAISGTYTFFIRVMQTSGGLGAIMSCRLLNDNGYIYMIRAHDNELEIHTDSQHKCGSNFSLTTDRVYKVVINGSTFKAVNLSTNNEFSFTYSTNRNMGIRMSTFNGYSGAAEGYLDRFYGLIGIARATTDAEDKKISSYLFKQGY